MAYIPPPLEAPRQYGLKRKGEGPHLGTILGIGVVGFTLFFIAVIIVAALQ